VKIFVAGHGGLVGSAIVRAIEGKDEHAWVGKTRSELDLLDRNAVFKYIAEEKPDAIIIAAAKVGGIQANFNYPVDFLTQNLQIQCNLMDAAHAANIEKLLFLASSCVYPKFADQPIKEEYLLTGELESTNEAYAIAKIAGIKLVQAYRKQYGRAWISAMPSNVYGPGDNYDLESSHVLAALVRKFYEAKNRGDKEVTLWGSGTPRREFLHADDLADACLFLIENYNDSIPINIGIGEDISIKELSNVISSVADFDGSIVWDQTRPDGTPQKLLDVTKLTKLGWRPKISLAKGISNVYRAYVEANT
jgi:GDP-L-fucose synthase